jgi:hypothetical protein
MSCHDTEGEAPPIGLSSSLPPAPLCPASLDSIRPERKIFKRSIKSKAKSKRVDIRAAVEMSGNEGVATKNLL